MAEWVITCNPNDYNVEGAFHDLRRVDWRQCNNIEVGDIIYIYVSNPIGEIKFKCIASKVNITIPDIDDSAYVLNQDDTGFYDRYMEIEMIDEYDNRKLKWELLKEHGLATVRGSSRVTAELHQYIDNCNNVVKTKITRDSKITILMNAMARPVTARELSDIIFPNNSNQSNVNAELNEMIRKGKVVRRGIGTSFSPYYYNLIEEKRRNYFYVMQNKTFDEEYGGGYLWAPQMGNNNSGANHSWSRMKEVKTGDVILHGYKQQVVAISIAKADCYPAMRPDELAVDWHREGWRVDTEYLIFDRAIYPKDFWNELEPLLPSMYGPFSKNGSGNQGYLFNANLEMCRCILENIAVSGSSVKGPVSKKTIVNKTLHLKIADFDKTVHDGENDLIDKVKQFVGDYTVMKLINLPKEDYAYGSGRKDTFCYRVTHELYWWGSIRSGTPNKYGFYYDPHKNKYQTVAKFGTTDTTTSTEAAYNSVKDAIYQLIVDGGNEDYAAIESNPLSTIFKGKLLCIYYPEKYMNVYSESHMKYYMDKLGITYSESDGYMTWLKQIIDWKNENPITNSWTNHEFSKFLYHGIGYPPDSEKYKKEVKKYEMKIDDELLESLDEVKSEELPNDNEYTPEPEDRKDPVATGESYSYPRDKNKALKALKRANYECEIDKDHPSFIRKTNGTNYTEPHHLVPMAEQDNFEYNLDVQANIVSLCSNCHNQLHYGQDPVPLLTKLYEARKNELKAAGIEITLDELIVLYK